MIRRTYKYTPLFLLLLLLTGCGTAPGSYAPLDPATAGFFTKYFVIPLSDLLDFFAKSLADSYGLSILIVTIIIRVIVLPLTLKQYRSSKAMQAIQPEMTKIREKFKDNPQKQQEETMKLFQKNGVNPLAGCFPILVQMPILLALYQAIIRNPNIFSHEFLWMKLGVPDPYYILPILAAITTYLQQKIMAKQNPMNKQMQTIMMIFPVMIFVMSMSFASALPLYWVYSNIFTIVQTYFLYGRTPKEKGGQAA
ncbi:MULTISPECIES: YidC/Oxa1 family membrane protein insertase [Paenibacillus]|uniref:Membrane protein insertase YidC n=1 Tax=Paenibacillus lutrae TaxID=2078573 RepID=A0A7X3FJ80_9BACL|nr:MULTISPECIES: YidC/Oxa1 family membrane protein insertase [Paenibacillus]MVP00764.1 membrane protein insertase YidC [Paenibacillus lutrae]